MLEHGYIQIYTGDGKACTENDECKAGGCVGVVSCDDANACTQDACDATGACSHVPACSVSGTIQGLGGIAVLVVSGAHSVQVTGDGPFTLSGFANGEPYFVQTAKVGASLPHCLVTGAVGAIAGGDVGGVAVKCGCGNGKVEADPVHAVDFVWHASTDQPTGNPLVCTLNGKTLLSVDAFFTCTLMRHPFAAPTLFNAGIHCAACESPKSTTVMLPPGSPYRQSLGVFTPTSRMHPLS